MSPLEFGLIVFALFCGSLPFAVWLGRYGLHTDVRNYGDGNPGAFNVLRAGGVMWGAVAIILDISKGALPVGLAAHVFNVSNEALVLIAIAPPIGHAFSPFLGFKGGKAIAATQGVLIGLSILELSLVAMLSLVFWYLCLTSSAWTVMFTISTLLLYMLVTESSSTWLIIVILLSLLLIQRHWHELDSLPRFRIPFFLRGLFQHRAQ